MLRFITAYANVVALDAAFRIWDCFMFDGSKVRFSLSMMPFLQVVLSPRFIATHLTYWFKMFMLVPLSELLSAADIQVILFNAR
jgi:hypothetical protein